jgi:hypothetical protein
MANKLPVQPPPSRHRQSSSGDGVYMTELSAERAVSTSNTMSMFEGHSDPHHHYRQTSQWPLSINTLLTSNERLKSALEFEEMETQKLEKDVREYKTKLDNALTVQSQLEEDLVRRDKQVTGIQFELKELRRAKNELETTLSQEVVNHMNEKERWLDREAEFQEKIEALKSSWDQAMLPPVPPPKEVTKKPTLTFSHSSTVTSTTNASNKATANNNHNKTIERLRGELDMCHQQMETVSREYSLSYDKVKKEMEQVQSLNARLMEENEGFQLLLAEKTIMGGFSLEDELNRSEEQSVPSEMDSLEAEIKTECESAAENDLAFQDKTRLYELEFENKSLQNHNRALRGSLERLVQRLLEYREFEKIVQEHNVISRRSISTFHERVVATTSPSSQTGSLDMPKIRKGALRSGYQGHGHSNSNPLFQMNPPPTSMGLGPRAYRGTIKASYTWSSMLFNNSAVSPTKDSSVRSVSLGVDDALPSTSPSTSASCAASFSSSSSSTVSTIGPTSISSMTSDEQLRNIIDEAPPLHQPTIRSIKSQKTLRPLKLLSPTATDVPPPLPSASSTSSGWSFY